ncbi:hypothetical protein BDY17DRAFT_320620 [Neohortaea acidophila]|uniref:Stress response RCI peptide n=1 Tax=Neohortaea acidophila TaxID=245834 RepID=A0A6A6Q7U1_9PEZI|nr:uncharacterized protein BDY17DRAFT_320620 [Neohortaea acidophila]KAF2488119.1 hypothetical protein BDY17DRAFT_320620 [Neohortaea acidophila]
MCGSDIFLGLIAILFPPIAVWVKRGICGADSIINILLCVLGFLPGLIHAWYIIAVTPDPTYVQLPQDAEQGRVTYYYVQTGPHYGTTAQPGQQGYGTTQSAAPNASGSTQPAQAASREEVPPTYQQAVGDHKVQKP